MKMKRIFRKNQIIITTLAIMIAAAGYLNYSGKKEVLNGEVFEAGAMEISDEDILAENQAVSGQAVGGETAENVSSGNVAGENAAGQYEEIASLDDPNEGDAAQTGLEQAGNTGEGTAVENPGEAVLTGGTSVTEYIANVQLSREQIRAKNKDTLLQIINNDSIDEASKQVAVQNMIDLTAISEKENAAETLLMAKGFADPVVSITDGKVDVVINAASITDPQRAQIEDIVKRKAEVGAENIVITLLNLQE